MISESEFKTIEAGDFVKIIPEWTDGCFQNGEGEMDRYLNRIVRVVCHNVDEGCLEIEQDKDDNNHHMSWWWNRYCIEKIIKKGFKFESASKDDLEGFIFND